MLKIKDSVDLIELKKFGFNRLIRMFGDRYQIGFVGGYINIEEIDREIDIYADLEDYSLGLPIDCGNILYDLIKADMVKKVVEDD